MPAFLAGLVPAIVGQAFKALVGGFTDWLKARQQRADQLELGQQQQKTVDQGAALEAQRRLGEAGAQPHDDETTKNRLRDGNF